VLLPLVDTYIVNTVFELRVRYMYRHLPFMIETLQLLMKSCENFDS